MRSAVLREQDLRGALCFKTRYGCAVDFGENVGGGLGRSGFGLAWRGFGGSLGSFSFGRSSFRFRCGGFGLCAECNNSLHDEDGKDCQECGGIFLRLHTHFYGSPYQVFNPAIIPSFIYL